MKRKNDFLLWFAVVASTLATLTGCGSDPARSNSSALACVEGTVGCDCHADATCNTGLLCLSGICGPVNCAPGQASCACLTGGLCNPGGTCINNVCEDPTGSVGHDCYSNGTCDFGATCDGQKICDACTPGQPGCSCAINAGAAPSCANGGSCVNNICTTGNAVVRKQNATMDCFLPCRGASSYTPPGGDEIDCDPNDNSLDVPVGTACPQLGSTTSICTAGACVAADGTTQTCATDYNCSDFQGCLQGVCAAECNIDGDCPNESYVCNEHVCRTVCGAGSTNNCSDPPGYTCKLNISDSTGFCMPSGESADAGTITTPTASVTTSTKDITFLNNPQGQVQDFTISNADKVDHVVTVTKMGHTDFADNNPATGKPPIIAPEHPLPDGGYNVGDVPMPWLAIGAKGATQLQNSYTVTVPKNGSVVVELNNQTTAGTPPANWLGTLNVTTNGGSGPTVVTLHYAAPASGHWIGNVYYFESSGDQGLDAWIAANRSGAVTVNNAFMTKWQAYRSNNNLSGISLYELQDVLNSTVNETWMDPGITAQCGTGFCYPTNSRPGLGLGSYSKADDTTQPIPRGPVKMQMGMDLYQSGSALTGFTLSGMINSIDALQYAGEPTVTINFANDPTDCKGGDMDVSGRCRVWATGLSADVLAGARYLTNQNDAHCSMRVLADGGAIPADGGGLPLGVTNDLTLAKTPWLVPGFTQAATPDPSSGLLYTYECRDSIEPLVGTAASQNAALAAANPIPDGRSRKRHLDLVDGFLYDTDQMMIIFRERFDSGFLGTNAQAADAGADAGQPVDAGFTKYGVMTLKRAPQPPTLTAPPTTQSPPPDTRPGSVPLQSASACDAVTTAAFGAPKAISTLTQPQIDQLFSLVVDGIPMGANPCSAPPSTAQYAASQVHYLCKTNGTFDGAQPCVNSDVTFFAFTSAGDIKNVDLSKNSCNTPLGSLDGGDPGPGFCASVLKAFEDGNEVDMNPIWRCNSDAGIDCDNVLDLRQNKAFFPSSANANGGAITPYLVYTPLQSAIDSAFRYKSQFASRGGTNVGFAPDICVPDSDSVPYCYDPAGIAKLHDRLSCLTYLYSTQYTQLSPTPNSCSTQDNRTRAHQIMQQQFSYLQDANPAPGSSTPAVHYGFEYLNSELLIMLGDDSYTKAFESRFDLANSLLASFQGSLFETGGIDLSGGAGYELYVLYQAAQYYQMVLDQFFSVSPYVWQSIQETSNPNLAGRAFIDGTTVNSFFTKLTRASTQKSNAWSEIAKRYQNIGRPDLARAVVEREYTATYLESILFGRFLTQLVSVTTGPQLTQLRFTLEQTKQNYQSALLGMQNVFSTITDNITYFGFPADYIPFPVVDDATGQTAFDVVMATANNAVLDAANKEELAITQDKSYETDQAAFQAQLTSISTQYDNQLSQICGTFVGDDGMTVYPAIPRYAPLGSKGPNPNNPNGAPRVLGDPCGLVGNGQINDAISALATAELDAQSVQVQRNNLTQQIQDEIQRVNAACNATVSADNFTWQIDGQEESLTDQIDHDKTNESNLDHALSLATTVTSMVPCLVGPGGSDCPSKIAASAMMAGIGAAMDGASSGIMNDEEGAENNLAALKTSQGKWQLDHACDLMNIDSTAKVQDLALGFAQLSVDSIKQLEAIHLALANISALKNQATQLEQQEKNASQLAINAAAAKDDPNTRIYRNDAIINADSSFQAALQAAYKATRVYEYYTSQSYANKGDLNLIRLVAHGDYNLQNYVRDLQTAYSNFQDNYGAPDVRVVAIDLCDDMLQIPYYDSTGKALSQLQRRDLCRAAVLDPARLDANGYIRIAFTTSAAQLSPVTADHKILYIESDFFQDGSAGNAADAENHVIAPRVYLTQKGVGTVNALLDGSRQYYQLPKRMAVLDSLFDGYASPALTSDVFKNEQLRGRPYMNTSWELALNLKDEPANAEIDMSEFEDIQLWVYYTDFTVQQ